MPPTQASPWPVRSGPDETSQIAVEARSISKIYDVRGRRLVAVRDVDLTIRRDEFVCVVGASGCGKSTLLRIISGLTPVSEGSIRVFGEDVRGPLPDVGVVFQSPTLLPWKTVLKNVLFPIRVLRKPSKHHLERAHDLLALVGLRGFEDRHPAELSGGMQQRVAIARSLIHDPQLLVLDEPFGALDQFTRETMNEELARIWSNARKTSILITHSIEEAISLGDRVIVMTPRPGQVAGIVDVDLERPRDRTSRRTPMFNGLRGRVEELLEV